VYFENMKGKVLMVALSVVILATIFCLVPLKPVAPLTLNCSTFSSLTFNASGYVRVEDQQAVAAVQVENTDDVGGNFTVYFFGFIPILGNSSMIVILPLEANQQKIAECPSESIGNWTYHVISGTRVTKSQWEIGKRSVTLLDYLLHYQLAPT
jgi:hypothetical protein